MEASNLCPNCGSVLDEHWTSEGSFYSCIRCHSIEYQDKFSDANWPSSADLKNKIKEYQDER